VNATTAAALAFLPLALCACGGRTQTGVDEHGNAFSARIQVVGLQGDPRTDAEVVVRPSDWIPGEPLDSTGPSPEAVRLRTDGGGYCVIERLRSGSYSLRAGDSLLASRISLDPESSGGVLRVVLDSVGALTGVVRGGGPGLRVAVQGLEQTARTDSSGRFVLPFVPKGSHRLAIGEPGHARRVSPVEVHPGRATETTPLDYDPSAPKDIVATGSDLAALLPATVDPPPGAYRDSVHVRAFAALPGDSLFVSQGGSPWAPWSERTLRQDACLLLKTVRATATYFPIRTVCYTISP